LPRALIEGSKLLIVTGSSNAALPPGERKSFAFPESLLEYFRGSAAVLPMFQVSRDNPAYFLTSVAHRRLPIFRTDAVKSIVCKALDDARNSSGAMVFAYVLMPDHTHLLTDGRRSIADTLRFINGNTAKRVIDYLRENNFESSLFKLRKQVGERNHKHSVFEHHPDAFLVTSESKFIEKVNYIHLNPVRAGLVEKPEDYLYSSSRLWRGEPIEDEPFITDHKKIKWRPAA
jgi:putative transposase